MRLFRSRTRKLSNNAQGFTIVELMIATMIFSVILTVITAGVISFTTRYYKGINASTTQTTARTILDTISQAIQFGTSDVYTTDSGDGTFFCAGGYRFSFNKGVKYTGSETGLQMAAMTGATCDTSSPNGKQLLGKNMRLTSLSVTKVGSTSNLYNVSLSVAYGDDDLLCLPSGSSCDTVTPPVWNDAIRCRSSTGSQFCSTSKLTTVVARRTD